MAAQVLIVGCGRLGAMVAQVLVDRGDRVTIVDTDAENFRRLAEQPGLSMIVADGTSNEDLRRAGEVERHSRPENSIATWWTPSCT